MSRLFEDFENQLQTLNRGISFMDKEAILFHELDLQMKIYTLFFVIGVMMIMLGVLF